MTFANVLVALGYLTQIWIEGQRISKLIATALREGRDLTDKELLDVKDKAKSARKELEDKL